MNNQQHNLLVNDKKCTVSKMKMRLVVIMLSFFVGEDASPLSLTPLTVIDEVLQEEIIRRDL